MVGGGVLKVFAMAEVRIGTVPLAEPAEEIRALLLRLCCAVLGRESAGVFGCEVMLSDADTDRCRFFFGFVGVHPLFLWARWMPTVFCQLMLPSIIYTPKNCTRYTSRALGFEVRVLYMCIYCTPFSRQHVHSKK